MAQAIFKTNLKVKLADLLSADFKSSDANSYFLFIGKISEWADENVPPKNTDSSEEANEAWRNSFFVKRILAKDIRMIVPRFYWSPRQVYTEYTDNIDLFDESIPGGSSNFYVVTPENHIYKCLFNNNRAESTVMPSGTSVNVLKTSDGYIWKYMYTLLAEDLHFSTSYKMPVHRAVATDQESALIDQFAVQQNAVRGSMDFVEMTNSGAPFLLASTAAGIPLGSSAAAGTTTANISGLSLYNETENIFAGYTVRVVSGEGVGQVRDIVSSAVNTIVVDPPWEYALSADGGATAGKTMVAIVPTITTFGDGQDLQVVARLDRNKRASAVDVVNRGKDYTTVRYSIYPGITGPYNAGDAADHRVDADTFGEVALNFVSPPHGGHGSDAPNELGADSVMIYITLDENDFEELGMAAVNEFRQFGLVMNPTLSSSFGDGTDVGKDAAFYTEDEYEMDVTSLIPNGFDGTEFNIGGISVAGQTGTYVIGSSSLAKARILNVNIDSTSVITLTTSQPQGTFSATEQLSWYMLGSSGPTISTTETSLQPGVFNMARFGSIVQGVQNREIFDNSVRITLDATGNQTVDGLIESSFSQDEIIANYSTGISGSSFRVLSWVPAVTGASGTGSVRGVDYFTGLQISDYLYNSDGITIGQVTGVTGPELNYNSGEVLYIQNMRPIERSPQQEEEIKIMIGF